MLLGSVVSPDPVRLGSVVSPDPVRLGSVVSPGSVVAARPACPADPEPLAMAAHRRVTGAGVVGALVALTGDLTPPRRRLSVRYVAWQGTTDTVSVAGPAATRTHWDPRQLHRTRRAKCAAVRILGDGLACLNIN